MKKSSMLLLLVWFACSTLYGQQTNPSGPKNPGASDSISIQNKLVELAWENAINREVLANEEAISEFKVELAKRSWMNNIYASGNLNEFTLKDFGNNQNEATGNNPFFPRYNFGINISLGTIFNNNLEKKIAKENLKSSGSELAAYQRALRLEVLKQYYDYLMYKDIYKIQGDIEADEYSKLLLLEEKFRTGEVTIESYNAGLTAYNNSMIAKARAKREYSVAQIDLESTIGSPLEDVL